MTLSTLAVVNSEASILLAAIAVPVAILGTVAVRLAAAPRRGSACVSQLGS